MRLYSGLKKNNQKRMTNNLCVYYLRSMNNKMNINIMIVQLIDSRFLRGSPSVV